MSRDSFIVVKVQELRMMIERSENNNISRLDRSELRPVNLGRCQPILEG